MIGVYNKLVKLEGYDKFDQQRECLQSPFKARAGIVHRREFKLSTADDVINCRARDPR
jgi:hypothetical protein